MKRYSIGKVTRYVILDDEKRVNLEEYDEIIRAEETNIFYIKVGDLWGLYDADNNKKTSAKYKSISEFYGKTAITSEVVKKCGKRHFKLIGMDLKELTGDKCYKNIYYAENGLFIAVADEEESRRGVLDSKGKVIVPCEYDFIDTEVTIRDKSYISLSKKDGESILIDEKGVIYTISPK